MTQRPSFRDIAPPLDVDDGALARLNDQMGVPALRNPTPKPAVNDRETPQDAPRPEPLPSPSAKAKDQQPVKKPALAPKPPRKALEKLTAELPGYLIDALKRDAIDRHTTVRHVLMLALQSAGFRIEAADLVPYASRRNAGKP